MIAGRPNAGKSSLFNSFLKEDRSIVTEIPGTTRDWIEAYVSIEGIPVRLIDTAGLREAPGEVEKIGIERSRKLLREADVVLYLIDGEQGITAEDNEELGMRNEGCKENTDREIFKNKSLILWNKCDTAPLPRPFPIPNVNPICVSAKTGEGISALYAAITSAILKQTGGFPLDGQEASLGTIRQKNLTDAACSRLEEALALAEKDEPLDLIAPLLREAVNSLGEITGEVSTADILEEMFSKFCVGK